MKKTILAVLLASSLAAKADPAKATITSEAPMEELDATGHPAGVSTAVPGTSYTVLRYDPAGPNGQPMIILTDGQNHQYEVAASATDYAVAPAPVAVPHTAAGPMTASSNPGAQNANVSDNATLTHFLEDSGTSLRYKFLFTRASTAKTRPLGDATEIQNFQASFNTPEKQQQYDSIILEIAGRAYSQFDASDLAAIHDFLQSPASAGFKTAGAPPSPVPGSVNDLAKQWHTANARNPMADYQIHTEETLRMLKTGSLGIHSLEAITQAIDNGELEGLSDGILSAPAYADRSDEVKTLVAKAKATPEKSDFLQKVDSGITQNGQHPIADSSDLQQREEEAIVDLLALSYLDTMTPSEISDWQKFALSPAGQKLYQFRTDFLNQLYDTVAKEWHDQRYNSVKTWASANPDEAFKDLQNLDAIPPVSPVPSPSDVR